MARSIKNAWSEKGVPANDDAVLKLAQDVVRGRQEAARQNLMHLQGLEIKHLENERKWIDQEKARDVSAFNQKEITAINQRYDRLVHRMERRNNTFMRKMARVFGGHKRQQRRIDTINAERDRVVAERTKQHVRREAQRQRSLSERDVRVERDLQEARTRHSDAREKQSQAHEQGFDFAVKQQMNRLRHVPKQRM